jgi:parallel beta-helix repeat protein
VHSGSYYENVVVNKQLTLTSDGDPVVDAGGTGNAITLSWSADGCTLEGFVATNSTRGYPIFDVGIKVNSDGNTIEGNTVNGNAHGISLFSSSGNTISDNTASGNYFDGIRLEYSSGNTISDNIANGNNNGITIYSSSDNNIIIGNTARDNRDSGIKLGYYKGDNNTIEGNTVICNKL